MPVLTSTSEAWVRLPVAARELGVGIEVVRRLIESQQLTVRRIPGAWPLVLMTEVQQLAENCTRRRPGAAPALGPAGIDA